ncbi:hypothetical protein KL86DPRO_10031 [uncultured delta proteobacterium]|uniref:Uncharacterized protein n=1 Tax=uncultured delta proteobacterium TaxID=34034 RepID=A0A212ITC4_9DELT|nr:hypothetical protein KL86DPRO_10031 [uncultured delta proteobacterium]
MVKGYVARQGIEGEKFRLQCVVSPGNGFGVAGSRREYGADGMHPRIPFGVGVHAQKPGQVHVKAGFLLGFAHGGMFHAFAVVDKTAGKRPAQGRVLPPDKNDSLFRVMDHRVHSRRRGAVPTALRAGAGKIVRFFRVLHRKSYPASHDSGAKSKETAGLVKTSRFASQKQEHCIKNQRCQLFFSSYPRKNYS